MSDSRSLSSTAVRLMCNAVRFRYNRLKNTRLKPAVLSLAVTNRCNSHCIMCNIWKTAGDMPDIKSRELSLRQIIDLLSHPVFSELVELDLTGGEPHLRDDLVDIVSGIARLKKNYLPRLRSIIVTSNGFLSERIISNYGTILNALEDTNIDLVSVISIDGLGETHDLVRGTRDAFTLASGTIAGLSELKQKYPCLITGIKTTILPYNIAFLDNILDYALSRNLFHIISPVLFTEARFKNNDKREKLALGTDGHKKVLDFYYRDELKDSYFYATSRGFLATGRKRWTCTALYNYAFVDYDGQVYPCEIIPAPIGNVKEQKFKDIWDSSQTYSRRRKIDQREFCRTCHEPGAIRYSAIAEGAGYLKFLSGLGRQKYNESLKGEGFSKYLDN